MLKYYLYRFITFPRWIMYRTYDFLFFSYTKLLKLYYGYGIHLYVGKFGQGKTFSMVYDAYKLACKYKNLHILTNINLQNFPSWTKISKLNTVDDIINAQNETLVLIDEIGTIFNSRDFNSSCGSGISKSLFQHLCQCRKRNISIFGTVQRYNLLDKQIRDITTDVTVCRSDSKYPFSRYILTTTYDIDEYEMYMSNRTYNPAKLCNNVYFQSNMSRNLYDTKQLIDDMLKKDYISDSEILCNRGDIFNNTSVLDKKQNKFIRNRKKL